MCIHAYLFLNTHFYEKKLITKCVLGIKAKIKVVYINYRFIDRLCGEQTLLDQFRKWNH